MVNPACECFFPLTLGLWVSIAQHPQVQIWPFPPPPGLHVREVEGDLCRLGRAAQVAAQAVGERRAVSRRDRASASC